MERVQYKEFIIEPRVWPLKDSKFSAEFVIELHDGPGVTVTKFFIENTFDTEKQARDHAIAGGKRVIDEGRV